MRHVAAVDPDLPIPQVVPATDGSDVVTIVDDEGRACLARLITVVPGTALEGHVVTEDLAEQVGAATARTARALRGFFHPAGGSRALDWEVRALPAVAAAADLAPDDPLREVVRRVTAVLPALAALPSGIHHGDVTLTNLLATDGRVTGVIDFGDMHHTADVADLAVALTSVLRNTSDTQVSSPWELAGATLRGYQRLRPLTHDEVEVLGELVLSRLALSTIISRRRAVTHPDNTAYITQYDDANARTTTRAAAAVTGRAGAATAPPRGHGDGDGRRHRGAPPPSCGRDGRDGRATVLRPAPADRQRRGDVARRGGRPPLPRRLQQRRRRRARRPDRRPAGRAPARAAQHPLALPPPRGRRARRAAGGDDAAGLDTVLFTTSGTEANELAWRLATEATGGTGALVVEHSYHGTTRWMADLSSNEWPPGHRPDAVGTFRAPVDPGDLGIESTTDQVRAAGSRARRPRPPPRAAAGRLRLHQRGRARRPRDVLPGAARRRPRGGCALRRRRGADRLRPHRAGALALRPVRASSPTSSPSASRWARATRSERSSPGASSSTGSPSATTTSRPSPPPPRPRPPATRCSTCSRTDASRSAPSSPAPTSSTGCATSRVRRTCWATYAAWGSWPGSTWSTGRPRAGCSRRSSGAARSPGSPGRAATSSRCARRWSGTPRTPTSSSTSWRGRWTTSRPATSG